MKNCVRMIVGAVMASTCVASAAAAQGDIRATSHAPLQPVKAAHYLFYLHGQILEDQGLAAVSPDYGPYEYAAIVNQFADSGFTVVSEVRAARTDVAQYADSVAAQVNRLLAAGVARDHIAVLGASKGAMITMLISTRVTTPIRYVILAGCNDGSRQRLAPRLHGDVLSIFENSDTIGRSCGAIFGDSPALGKHKEIELHTGRKHGFLFHPLPEWIGPAVSWIRGRG